MTRVVITGMSALSPFGLTARALWDGLVSGQPAVRSIATLVAGGLPVTTGGEVALDAEEPARDVALGARAIGDALAAAGLPASATALVWANGLDTFAHEPPPPDWTGVYIAVSK